MTNSLISNISNPRIGSEISSHRIVDENNKGGRICTRGAVIGRGDYRRRGESMVGDRDGSLMVCNAERELSSCRVAGFYRAILLLNEVDIYC